MGAYRVRLLGKFEVCSGERPLSGFEGRRLQEFFCYLLLRRERPQARESLAELLAGDATADQSRKYLRQALWQIQMALGGEHVRLEAGNGSTPASEERLLIVDAEWVQVNPQVCLWLDVAEFERAFTPVIGMPGEALAPEAAAALRDGIGLYRGELLEGCYQDWCLLERERLQNVYLAMLDKLMAYCTARGEYEQGAVYGSSILGVDRARERTHQRLMRLHYLAGDRTGALRQYERCVAALKEELGVTPSRRTVQLYQKICSDVFDGESEPPWRDESAGDALKSHPADSNGHTAAGRNGLQETVNDLRNCFRSIAGLHNRIEQDLDVLARSAWEDGH